MFISYEFSKYIGYDQETKKKSYLYKIIDLEFEEEVALRTAVPALMEEEPEAVEQRVAERAAAGVAAVEKVYHKRGYSCPQIAKQIFLCMRYLSHKYIYSMNDLISWQKEYNPELWEKYGQEINKFLLFS